MLKIDSFKTVASDTDRLFLSEILNKKYKVLSKLGKGGFGEILMVQELDSHKTYAIKK